MQNKKRTPKVPRPRVRGTHAMRQKIKFAGLKPRMTDMTRALLADEEQQQQQEAAEEEPEQKQESN
jgi:hypothetical protein